MDASTDDVTPTRVSKILIQDDGDSNNSSLVWTRSDGAEDKASTNSVLFVLDVSASSRGFITCLLRQGSVDGDCPQLLLLSTETVPPSEIKPVIRHLPPQLDKDSEVDVIVSSRSGTGLGPLFWRKVLRPLLHLVYDALGNGRVPKEAFLTPDAQAVKRFGKELRGREDGTRLVVLLSGDGGVADLLAGYGVEEAVTKPIIALLPLGTGNALFHSLHRHPSSSSSSSESPSPLVQGIRTLFLGNPAPLPLFRTSFTPPAKGVSSEDGEEAKTTTTTTIHGVVVASYGFHASLIHESDTPEHRTQGSKRFSIVAESLLAEGHGYEAEVQVDDDDDFKVLRKHGYVLISMVSNLERTFVISPASKPLDNRLHLIRFGNLDATRVMDVMRRAYQGGDHVGLRWDDGEEVTYRDVDEVRVKVLDEDGRWRKVCVDGTIVDVPRGGCVTISKTEARPFRILVDALVLQPS
ncbi:hypothetical protein CP532_6730 [Ophiocordyceps camponoti-leonardi (nom. inval.)]|nr:hypothetical protein CP532_6730 [Ophiocordyceps camponoti-leonardi (nom. inval.)]